MTLFRCPVDMAGEQAVHEAKVIDEEQTEADADQAGGGRKEAFMDPLAP